MTQRRPLRFLVVGSARSGTTLVQRLVCELPGVAMPPETHFFSVFVRGLLERQPFPVPAPALAEELGRWAALEEVRAADFDAARVIRRLGDCCRSPWDMFEALVDSEAEPGDVLGEKTPGHLLWWQPISRAAPALRFIAVVRDPRAVVASNLRAPWVTAYFRDGWSTEDVHVALATRWRFEQEQLAAMVDAMPDRCTVVQYEQLVADPEGSRGRLAEFLGVDNLMPGLPPADPGFVRQWESWKEGALEPIAEHRATAWTAELPTRAAAEIAGICREVMERFGYRDRRPGPISRRVAMRRLTRSGAAQRLHSLRTWLEADQQSINQVDL